MPRKKTGKLKQLNRFVAVEHPHWTIRDRATQTDITSAELDRTEAKSLADMLSKLDQCNLPIVCVIDNESLTLPNIPYENWNNYIKR